MKYRALYDLLNGQTNVLKATIKDALNRYDTQGDNEKVMIEGFFALVEAVEKVVTAQMILTGNEKPTELSEFLKRTKQAFKALDMAMIKNEDNAVKKAMEEKQGATIH